MGGDEHTAGDEELAKAPSFKASSQKERGVSAPEYSRFSDEYKHESGQAPPREFMATHDAQRCPQGDSGIDKKSSTAPAEVRQAPILEPSSGEGEESGYGDRKEESSAGGASSDFLCEDTNANERDDADEEYESKRSKEISAAVISSKARRQIETESSTALLDSAAPPPEAREANPPPAQANVCVESVRDRLDTSNAAEQGATGTTEEDKTNHATTSSGQRGQTHESPYEPEAAGTNPRGVEGQEVEEGETTGTGNGGERSADPSPKRDEIRAAVAGNGPREDDEASADAMSFVKDDDVSGSDDEFGKEVAKYVGENQQQQGRRRRSGEGGRQREQSRGRGEGNDEIVAGESLLLPFGFLAIRLLCTNVDGANSTLPAVRFSRLGFGVCAHGKYAT